MTQLGGVYGDLGEYEKAIDIFTEAIRFDKNDFKAHLGRGICYDMKEKYDDALKDYDRAIAINQSKQEI